MGAGVKSACCCERVSGADCGAGHRHKIPLQGKAGMNPRCCHNVKASMGLDSTTCTKSELVAST